MCEFRYPDRGPLLGGPLIVSLFFQERDGFRRLLSARPESRLSATTRRATPAGGGGWRRGCGPRAGGRRSRGGPAAAPPACAARQPPAAPARRRRRRRSIARAGRLDRLRMTRAESAGDVT